MTISAALFGCPNHGETCGPSAGSAGTLAVAGSNVALDYGALESGQNNDCPGIPGVVSLTITGSEITTGSGFGVIAFCVPRPDLLETTPQSLGGSDVQVVDVGSTDASCVLKLDGSVAPTGTMSTTGMCDDGSNAAGFTMTLDGHVTLDRTCGSATDTVAVTLTGTVDVSPMQQ